MPQVTVYIREDDLPKWKALPSKALFIHEALISGVKQPKELKSNEKFITEFPKEFIPKLPGPKGYPCCTRQTRCKHWTWDSEKEDWLNTLTGELKGA